MASQLSQEIVKQIENAQLSYYRLVIVVGPSRSGKSAALRQLQSERGWAFVNVNLSVSQKLLELASRQWALRVARIVDDLVREQPCDTVLLDNIEMLFHPDLQQDPLRLLQSLSRNRTIVATWRGAHLGSTLTYGSPDHPEFRRFDEPQAIIVFSGGVPSSNGATSAQEHSV